MHEKNQKQQREEERREDGVAMWLGCWICKSGGPEFKSSCLPLDEFVFGGPRFNCSTLCKKPTMFYVACCGAPFQTHFTLPWIREAQLSAETYNQENSSMYLSDNRELKQTMITMAMKMSPNKRFNEQNNRSARAL